MTFASLSYLVWYKKYRNLVKEMVLSGDFSSAESRLVALIAEHEATLAVDHSTNTSELGHMKHALRHIRARLPNDTQRIKDKIPTILSYDPEQTHPQIPH